MKRKIHTLIVLAVVYVALPIQTHAAGLVVEFESAPLFSEVQFMPGSDVYRDIHVRNTGDISQSVYLRAIETTSGGLEEVINLVVYSGTSQYFEGTLADFYATSSVFLGGLSGGDERIYTLAASFASTSDEAYQDKTTGFGVEVGFSGGESVTDTTGSSGSTAPSGSNQREEGDETFFSEILSRITAASLELERADDVQGVQSQADTSEQSQLEESAEDTTDIEGEVKGDQIERVPETEKEESELGASASGAFSDASPLLLIGTLILLASLLWYTQRRSVEDYPH